MSPNKQTYMYGYDELGISMSERARQGIAGLEASLVKERRQDRCAQRVPQRILLNETAHDTHEPLIMRAVVKRKDFNMMSHITMTSVLVHPVSVLPERLDAGNAFGTITRERKDEDRVGNLHRRVGILRPCITASVDDCSKERLAMRQDEEHDLRLCEWRKNRKKNKL